MSETMPETMQCGEYTGVRRDDDGWRFEVGRYLVVSRETSGRTTWRVMENFGGYRLAAKKFAKPEAAIARAEQCDTADATNTAD